MSDTTGGDIVSLDVGRRDRIRQQMTIANEGAFNSPDTRQLYIDIFHSLLDDAETLPGYNTAMELLCERLAFLWTAQKVYDTENEPTRALHYEKLTQRFLQTMRALFQSRDDRQADESFKRQFTNAMIDAVATGIESVAQSPEEAHRYQQAIIARLRSTVVEHGER